MADFCPHCSTDLWGGPIPEGIRQHYSPPYRWRRDIAIYDRASDRTIAFECPDCRERWSANSAVSDAAVQHISQIQRPEDCNNT